MEKRALRQLSSNMSRNSWRLLEAIGSPATGVFRRFEVMKILFRQ